MTTYRTGNRNPRNIYRVGEHVEEHIGCMFDPADGPLVVEALNAGTVPPGPCAVTLTNSLLADGSVWCDLRHGHEGDHVSGPTRWRVDSDSCTCTKAGPDPDCVVHQGRRARGPKPPPLGPGCICDGSGRTCPRHGAVS